jgi:hypothetical protein
MARIPEAEIERLKAEVSVQRLAEARGIKLERRGADLVGLCLPYWAIPSISSLLCDRTTGTSCLEKEKCVNS